MCSPADFAPAFDSRATRGLASPPMPVRSRGRESCVDSLDYLRPSRIGHGVRAIEDAALVDRLVAEGIVLEVCPGSNLVLGVYPTCDDHPIDRLLRAGIPVTVSTDDPPFFTPRCAMNTPSSPRVFGWTKTSFDAINRMALNAAFCDEATRARLLKHLEEPR